MKRPATYVLWGDGNCLYVGATEHIGQRLTNHSNQKMWWGEVATIEVRNHATIEQARREEADLIEEFRPVHNVIRRHVAASEWGAATGASEHVSVAQAAAELHLTERAVRHRIKAGTLAAIKLGPGTAAYVISRAEVERAKSGRAA